MGNGELLLEHAVELGLSRWPKAGHGGEVDDDGYGGGEDRPAAVDGFGMDEPLDGVDLMVSVMVRMGHGGGWVCFLQDGRCDAQCVRYGFVGFARC